MRNQAGVNGKDVRRQNSEVRSQWNPLNSEICILNSDVFAFDVLNSDVFAFDVHAVLDSSRSTHLKNE